MFKATPVPSASRRAIATLVAGATLFVALFAVLGSSEQARATTPASTCLTNPLGQATGYTEFVKTDGQRGAESEGAIAYGGNLNANWMTTGTHLNVAKTYPSVVVNGTANGFNIQKGSAWLPNRTMNSNFNGGGTYLTSAPIEFSSAFNELDALSASLAGQAANGTTAVVNTGSSPNPTGISLGGNALYLKGTDSGVNVFSVSPAQLTGIVAIMVEVPTGATAIVNVSGSTVQFNGQMWFRSAVGGSWNQAQDNATATQNARTLWNLPEATNVKLNTGSAFGGTILATKAHVHAQSVGHNIGQVIAKSFQSGFETHHAPFVGCLPSDTPTPPDPPKKPKLKISKIVDNGAVTEGDHVVFTLSVKNHGEGPAENVKVSDNVPDGLEIISADAPCIVTGQQVECVKGTLAAGQTATYKVKVKTTLPAVHATSGNEQLTIGKVERHITLNAGETRTETITCEAGGIMSDGAVRIDHINQGTGDYGDIQVHKVRSTGKGTYEAQVTNHATGQAQVKLFGVCLPGKTTEGRDLIVGEPVTKTVTLDAGVHTVNLGCAAGSTPIAPGIEVSGGRALVLASAPDGATGRKVTVKVDEPGTQVKISIRCLGNRTAESRGSSTELIFTQVTKPITVGAGGIATEALICGENAKGIVAGWEFEDGLVPLGNDPQPKSRVFKVWNPTSHPLTGTLYLLCLEARTGSSTPVNEKTYVNTASVSTTSEQEPGGQSSDSASVLVTRATGNGGVTPTVYSARVKGRTLLVKVRTGGKAGRVIVRSTRAMRVGKKKVRRGTVVGKGRFAGKKGTSISKIRLGKAARKAIRTGKLKRVRVTVRSSTGSKTRTVRVQR
ncbi:MAG: choice-of-anchor A family protein [Actinomycetota bacterium]|nr:choice-of-anchor A family protein [Actinomycetota bacterium]